MYYAYLSRSLSVQWSWSAGHTMIALFILLIVIVTLLAPCHNQITCYSSSTSSTINELYRLRNTSAQLTISCADVCLEPPHRTNCSAAWYHNGSRLGSSTLIIENDGDCGHYYCQDETKNVTLKTVVLTPSGEWTAIAIQLI